MDNFKLWLNFCSAWLAVVLAILLSIIYILRYIRKRESRYTLAIKKFNAFLRRHHKAMGIALVVLGLIHGLVSSESVFTINIGTISWIVSILLGINWLIRKKFSMQKGWMYYHRVLTLLFLVLVLWHVVDVGGIQAPKVLFGYGLPPVQQTMAPTAATIENTPKTLPSSSIAVTASPEVTPSPEVTALVSKQYQGAQLKDGTFTGEATGYKPGLQVSVVIKDNAIVSVTVTDHNEVNSRFYSWPITIVPQEIIDRQSTEVDTVSSATFTSVGIINAVNNALSKALISGSLPSDKALPMKRGRH